VQRKPRAFPAAEASTGEGNLTSGQKKGARIANAEGVRGKKARPSCPPPEWGKKVPGAEEVQAGLGCGTCKKDGRPIRASHEADGQKKIKATATFVNEVIS